MDVHDQIMQTTQYAELLEAPVSITHNISQQVQTCHILHITSAQNVHRL